MSYDTGVPQATDRVSDTQQPILTNFQVLNSIYGGDHFDYTDVSSNTGRHKQVTFPNRSGTPPTTGASVGAAYARTTSSQTYPYWRRDGGSLDYPLLPIKAFCFCTVSGTTATIVRQFNMNTPTFLSTGRWQINLTNPLPDTNYAVIAQGGKDQNAVTYESGFSRLNITTQKFEVNFRKTDGGEGPTADDPQTFSIYVIWTP